jgi:RNA polymerase sigma-70 factor (ECF subfamily)
MQSINEEKIIEESKKNLSKFGPIYDEYYNDVYRYLYAMCSSTSKAEDLTAETFISALELLPNYEYRGISIRFWLISIARNLALKSFRKDKLLNDSVDIGDYIEKEPSSAKGEIDKAILSEMKKYLVLIPDGSREILILKIWEEYTFEEIAVLISMNENSVKTQYYRALEKIRQLMADDGYDERTALIPMILLSLNKLRDEVLVQEVPFTRVSMQSGYKKYLTLKNSAIGTSLLTIAIISAVVLISQNNNDDIKNNDNSTLKVISYVEDDLSVDDDSEELKEEEVVEVVEDEPVSQIPTPVAKPDPTPVVKPTPQPTPITYADYVSSNIAGFSFTYRTSLGTLSSSYTDFMNMEVVNIGDLEIMVNPSGNGSGGTSTTLESYVLNGATVYIYTIPNSTMFYYSAVFPSNGTNYASAVYSNTDRILGKTVFNEIVSSLRW